MSRPSEHTNHPLFKLRESLRRGEPLTQRELARLLDVPFITLQAVEAGRRGLQGIPATILQKILRKVRVRWDEQTKQWLFDLRHIRPEVPVGKNLVPITPDIFEECQAITGASLREDQKDLEKELFKAWLEELFNRIPDESRMALGARYSEFIEQCCRDFKLGEPASFFNTVSQNHRPILDAMNSHAVKGLKERELFERSASDLKRNLFLFEPASERWEAIVQMLNELPKILKSLPPETASKSRKKSQS